MTSSSQTFLARSWGGRVGGALGEEVRDLGVEEGAEYFLQLGVHHPELIRDVEDIEGRQIEVPEARGDPLRVLALHREDDVGPAEIGFADAASGLGADAGGADLEPRVGAVEPLGGNAALLVHGADEEDFEARGVQGVERSR